MLLRTSPQSTSPGCTSAVPATRGTGGAAMLLPYRTVRRTLDDVRRIRRGNGVQLRLRRGLRCRRRCGTIRAWPARFGPAPVRERDAMSNGGIREERHESRFAALLRGRVIAAVVAVVLFI